MLYETNVVVIESYFAILISISIKLTSFVVEITLFICKALSLKKRKIFFSKLIILIFNHPETIQLKVLISI